MNGISDKEEPFLAEDDYIVINSSGINVSLDRKWHHLFFSDYPNKSEILISRTSVMVLTVVTLGFNDPFSIRWIVLLATLQLSANSCWLIPDSSRFLRKLIPTWTRYMLSLLIERQIKRLKKFWSAAYLLPIFYIFV